MAIQFLPILKILAPLAAAALPSFQSKPTPSTQNDPSLALQIVELQQAVTQNAQSVRALTEHLQQSLQSIETAATDAKKQIAVYKTLLFVTAAMASVATLLSVYLLTRSG